MTRLAPSSRFFSLSVTNALLRSSKMPRGQWSRAFQALGAIVGNSVDDLLELHASVDVATDGSEVTPMDHVRNECDVLPRHADIVELAPAARGHHHSPW